MKKRTREIGLGGALLVLAVVAGLVPAARADLLVTGNGDSLSGDLTRVADGVLVFRTSLEGQMMVPMSEVKSLSTDGPWIITEASGAVHIGHFVPEGVAENAGEVGAGKVVPLALGAITSAKPLPAAIEAAGNTAPKSWSGSARTGVRAFEGTEDGLAPHMALEIQGMEAGTDIGLQLGFDVGDGDFPAYFTGCIELAAQSPPPWAPFVQALLERDTNQAMEMRTGFTLGVRHTFDERAGGTLQGLAGLGISYGRWDRRYLSGASLLSARDEETETTLNLHLGLRYTRAVWGGGTWANEVILLPGLTDLNDFRAGLSSSLTYPVGSRLQLRLDMLMNYDHDPVFTALDSLDTSLGASIQLQF